MDLTLQIILCIVVADFISGLVHWLEDSYLTLGTPLIGKLIAEPNIEHHRQPANMDQTFWGRNWVQIAFCLHLVAFLAVCGWMTWQVGLVLGILSLANEVHAWNHGVGTHWLSRMLQDMAIVQTPQHHSKHHHAPFDHRFCVITNWVNPLLDRIKFWARLESFIWMAFDVWPARMTWRRDYW